MFLGKEETASPTAVLPALDLAQVYDNAAELTEGWSFLDDTRNSFEVDGKR